jgi:hypothetical protein
LGKGAIEIAEEFCKNGHLFPGVKMIFGLQSTWKMSLYELGRASNCGQLGGLEAWKGNHGIDFGQNPRDRKFFECLTFYGMIRLYIFIKKDYRAASLMRYWGNSRHLK